MQLRQGQRRKLGLVSEPRLGPVLRATAER